MIFLIKIYSSRKVDKPVETRGHYIWCLPQLSPLSFLGKGKGLLLKAPQLGSAGQPASSEKAYASTSPVLRLQGHKPAPALGLFVWVPEIQTQVFMLERCVVHQLSHLISSQMYF